MTALNADFTFMICQNGAERALKEEVGRAYPSLRFAFSRPGFLTFKATEGPLDTGFAPGVVFARVCGLSLGAVPGDSDAARAEEVVRRARALGGLMRLHVYERDRFAPGDEARGYVPDANAQAPRALIEALGGPFLAGARAEPGELVLDVVVLEPGAWWLGAHRHHAGVSAWPGARPPVQLPAAAPSRVYAKVTEALDWSGAPLRRGDVVLDIGCAPGGGTFALLERGARVIGVDPAEMAPAVLGSASFEHRAVAFEQLAPQSLPRRVDWLLFDVNLSPMLTLKHLRGLVGGLRGLRGAILTLKLNTPGHAARVPWMLEQVQRMGMERVCATQLPSNRREICAFGLTRLGLARLAAGEVLETEP